MTETFNYDEDILQLLLNTTTYYTPSHKRYMISKLLKINQNTYKYFTDHFLFHILLLKTDYDRRIFRDLINFLDFCNKHYVIYLCKQILGEYQPDYGFKAYENFFLNSRRFFKATQDYDNQYSNPFNVFVNR